MLGKVLWSIAPAVPLAGPVPAQAQDYPSRQITMVVPFAVGGSVDNVGRASGQGRSWSRTARRHQLGAPAQRPNSATANAPGS